MIENAIFFRLGCLTTPESVSSWRASQVFAPKLTIKFDDVLDSLF